MYFQQTFGRTAPRQVIKRFTIEPTKNSHLQMAEPVKQNAMILNLTIGLLLSVSASVIGWMSLGGAWWAWAIAAWIMAAPVTLVLGWLSVVFGVPAAVREETKRDEYKVRR